MIASFREILEERRSHGAAAGAFTCYDATTAIGVVHAAEARDEPAILLVSESSFTSRDGRLLLPTLHAVADAAMVPVCVQLDHVTELELIRAALATGLVGAVMVDGSRLPLADNVGFVRAARKLAEPCGAHVEAELGHIEGGEDVARAAEAGGLTDPDEAASLARDAAPGCLAVSIGNVHGTYASEPRLDWERLERIRAAVTIPLSLHGASGLSDPDVERAVASGIAKVNVNTEIRARTFEELDRRLPELAPGYRVLELDAAVVEAVAEVVAAKLELLSGRAGSAG